MADLIDELLITRENPETIKARLLTDTNAGIEPADPAYLDTLPGSFWDDLEGAGCLEWDRLYDRLNEVVAAAIPALTFGAFADAWAASLDIERSAAAPAGGLVRFTGPAGTSVPAGTQVSTAQTSADSDPVTFQTIASTSIDGDGATEVSVVALDAGSQGGVPANTITILDTPLLNAGVPVDVAVTNLVAMSGGADVESDERLVARVLRRLSGAAGGGNQDDYIDWGLSYPGVGFVTVQPNTPGPGNVTVLITDLNNDPSPAITVDGLQERLDPEAAPAQGKGLAPIGATVFVAAPTSLAIAAVSDVVLEVGYSLDGAGGTRAVAADIEASVGRYINTLPVGADVVRSKVIAAIVDVVGVADFNTLTINASTAQTIAVSPTQVANLTTPVTLT